MRPEDISYYSNFLKEFQNESDRGTALIGAAFIDDRLAKTLESFFRDCKESRELLGNNGPIGTFNARIKVAYCIGLIDEFEYHEVEIIRKVRNEFAHQLHGISFATPKIISLCGCLKSNTPGDISGNPRLLFINSVICTSLNLFYRPEFIEVNRNKRNPKGRQGGTYD